MTELELTRRNNIEGLDISQITRLYKETAQTFNKWQQGDDIL